jgi:hypothetical protein
MEKLLKELLALMDQQSDILSKMIELAGKKTRLLADNQVEEINQILEAEQELEASMTEAEKKRGAVVDQIGSLLKLNGEMLKISDLVAYVDEPCRAALNFRRYDLQKKIDEYKEISELNLALIHNNLNYVDHMIQAVSEYRQPHVTYQEDGHARQERERLSYFDNKA